MSINGEGKSPDTVVEEVTHLTDNFKQFPLISHKSADCISLPINLSQHRPHGISQGVSGNTSQTSGDDKDRIKLECEIIDEELEIELKELQIRKRHLERRKLLLSSVGNSVEQPPRTEEKRATSIWDQAVNPSAEIQSPSHYAMRPPVDLPRVDIERFDGSPIAFCKFVRAFQMTVADHVPDNNRRLMYLIHYCSGEAKAAIDHCVFLPVSEGYNQAMEILQTQFGRPHDIVQAFMGDLLNGSIISTGDVASLQRLARKMTSCELALRQLNRTSELDCTTNIKRILERLPKHLRHKWAERADDMLSSGSEPTFSDLIKFIQRWVSISTNCYGVSASVEPQFKPNLRPKQINDSYRLNTVTATDISRCPICNKGHEVTECSTFNSMSHTARLNCLRELNLCFNCIKPNHRAALCRSLLRCGIDGCNQKHNRLLHYPNRSAESDPASNVNSLHDKGAKSCLGFVAVRIIGPKGALLTHALLDNGSDTTLLTEEAAGKLGIMGEPTVVDMTSIHGTSAWSTNVVNFAIQSLHDDSFINVDRALLVSKLPISRSYIPQPTDLKNYTHLSDIDPVCIPNKAVSVLIGINVPEAHWVLEQRVGTPKQPYACLTTLGWTVLGPIVHGSSRELGVNCLSVQNDTTEDILRLFESEFIENQCHKTLSVEDKLVLANTAEHTILCNERYTIPIPWKIDWRTQEFNKGMAVKRLQYLRGKLLKNENLLSMYTEIFKNYEIKGYISKVTATSADNLRFLPHHPVVNPRKPDKVRIVFDCAAKSRGISLNDCLFSGPDLTNDITGVLMRFRLHRVAISADIEEMFLKVHMPVADRAPFSFLWYTDGVLTDSPETYQFNVHLFGATSSPFCASYALQRTADDNSADFSQITTSTVRRNFYVDDCLVSVDKTDEAIKLVGELRCLLQRGGFRLHKWASNDGRVLDSIPESERALNSTDLNITESCLQRTLGLFWSAKDDCFMFKVTFPSAPTTRRGILSSTASLYDPLGFVAPLLLKPKRLLQSLCKRRLGWDECVDGDTETSWERWKAELRQIESLRIPRCIKPSELVIQNVSFHVFSDASEVGYGAVAYARYVSENKEISCTFLMGKSHVSPLKSVTIPRLELQAAVLAVKLMRHLRNELDLTQDYVYFWTDSTIVLHYILNTRSRFKTFVSNRVSFIHENSQVRQWRHVPSNENPADLASRGVNDLSHPILSQWLHGPGFLSSDETRWPHLDVKRFAIDNEEAEVKKISTVMLVNSSEEPFDRLLAYHSSWLRLRTSVAWLRRFMLYLRSKHSVPDVGPKGVLSLDELKYAESVIVGYVQRRCFAEVLSSVQKEERKISIRRSCLSKLRPILRNDLLCVGGRIKNCLIVPSSVNPVILPSSHPVTRCLIIHYHEIEGHMGVAHVLAAIRRKYWIIKGAATIKRVLNKCLPCRMRSAKPSEQIMSDLPLCRTTPGRAFSVTGVDLFGPFFIRLSRKTWKRYGCIFTCLKTRAVHIEVVHTLSIDSFMMALSRFSNRRGTPVEMFSDRGSNFVGAELELRRFAKSLNDETIKRRLIARDIKWHFNPPYSSHRGGIWERQIRSVRRVFSAVSFEQVLTEESLSTFLSEAEFILNNRPLTPIYDDATQLEVLTPNHLLLQSEHNGAFADSLDLRARYTRYWRQGQVMANTFWRRWLKEYLPLLQLRHKWIRVRRDFQSGDYVLFDMEGMPRGQWNKGIVLEPIPGEDGHVRQVIIRTKKGNVTRDIRRICLLEGIEESG